MHKFVPGIISAMLVATLCVAGLGLSSCEPAVRAADNTTTTSTNTNANTNASTNTNVIGSVTSGRIAATVDGTPIYEDTITNDIAQLRKDEGVTTAYAWAEWLGTNGYTAETIRDAAIDNYVTTEAVKKAAAEYGITADEEAITKLMNQMKSLYTSQDAWNTALENAGYTEETKRAEFEQASLEQQLMDTVTPSDSVDDQQTKFGEWLDNYKYSMNVIIYEMPSGLPYAVGSFS